MVQKSGLVVSFPSRTVQQAVGELPDTVETLVWDMTTPAPVDTLDLVVAPYMGKGASELAQLAGMTVGLVQSQSIGFDGVESALPPGFVFANAASVHETSTAELTVALILAAQRGIPDFVRAAQKGEWAAALYPSLADRTVMIVGLGGVGKAIEARLLPFETTIVRVASTARTDDNGRVHSLSDVPDLIADVDIVVIAVPLTPATTALVDDAFLARMKDGSLLVNIARGPVVDTDALLAHTANGRLRAALDVTDPEPLPAGHPLFALSNVLISPHVGGATDAMMPRMAKLLREQIDRMLRGQPPLNVVLRS